MVASNGLLPVVMGIGLAVLSAATLAGSRGGEDQAGWRDPLFVLAALLVGVSIFGAALYELGWSIENGHELSRADARTENWLIVALVLVLIAVAVRSAWTRFFYAADSPPWERGRLDRLMQLLGFSAAMLAALVVGLLLALILLRVARLDAGPAVVVVAVVVVLGLTCAWAVLRLMSGGDPSPRASLISRRAQLNTLAELDGAKGEWRTVEVRAVGRLEPALVLSATVWTTASGTHWRADDAYSLVRYHAWAANHLLAPTPAVHRQQLTIANAARREQAGLELKPWVGRRSSLRHALAMRRVDAAIAADASSPERAARLVHVPYEQLAAAGLRITIG